MDVVFKKQRELVESAQAERMEQVDMLARGGQKEGQKAEAQAHPCVGTRTNLHTLSLREC